MDIFRNDIARTTFYNKYALTQSDTWAERSRVVVDGVVGKRDHRRLMSKGDQAELTQYVRQMKFIPGGRYLYYGGRGADFWNNCFLLKAEEDTREEWGALAQRSTNCLMTGGGIGIDYSILRGEGEIIKRTGGVASGPLSLAYMVNGIGSNVMQGGQRRAAIYGSLNWQHPDAGKWLEAKDWDSMPIAGTDLTVGDMKRFDFNYPAPLDMTNISLNYDDDFLLAIKRGTLPPTYLRNVENALRTGEPGFSFNFGSKLYETLRNACCEVTSEDDSDVCNLGAINMANIDTPEEFRDVVRLAAKFLVCGTMRAELPYDKVYQIREKNRRLGLGLMGVHEWLLKRGYKYEMNDELRMWLQIYKEESESAANEHCDRLFLNRPKGYRSIAPTGTIGILA